MRPLCSLRLIYIYRFYSKNVCLAQFSKIVRPFLCKFKKALFFNFPPYQANVCFLFSSFPAIRAATAAQWCTRSTRTSFSTKRVSIIHTHTHTIPPKKKTKKDIAKLCRWEFGCMKTLSKSRKLFFRLHKQQQAKEGESKLFLFWREENLLLPLPPFRFMQ